MTPHTKVKQNISGIMRGMHKTKLLWQERPSDSPIVESIWTCNTPVAISRTVIADPCITISLVKINGHREVVIEGPKTKPHRTLLPAGYTCTGVRLKLGVCLKNLLTQKLTDASFTFPANSESQFQLGGVTLQFPDFTHAEQLIDQLHDLKFLEYKKPRDNRHAQTPDHLSARTHSRQVQRTTGLSPYQLYQLERAHRALRLLKRGIPAAEVASELAYVDQSHLIRASKKFFGHTPKQLADLPQTP